MNRCLGRLPSPPDSRTLRLCDFRGAGIPPPPPERRWDKAVPAFSLGGNNRYGNCVIVAAANEILLWWAADSGNTSPIADAAIIELSREMGAMNGYNILERLKYWRKNQMWANRLWAFAAVHPTDRAEIENAVNACGLVDIGVNMPLAWQSADEWTTGSGRHYAPGSWGGHSVPIVGYDAHACYVASWGQVIPFLWDALPRYCDEAYALLDPEWIGPDGTSPNFLDLPALHAALQELSR